MTDHTILVALITVGGLVLVSLITSVTTLIVGRKAASKDQVINLELKLDGKLDKFIQVSSEAAHAKGVLETNERRDRKDANFEAGRVAGAAETK